MRSMDRRWSVLSPFGCAAFALLGIALLAHTAPAQQPLLGAPCTALADNPVMEPGTSRTYLLDYPCDYRPGDNVTLILNLHGGGSSGTWQRRYFPAFDQKDRYDLVIASPYSPIRRWTEDDDAYLRNIVATLVGAVRAENIDRFWLVGHSQGGSTSRRLVCTPFFERRVDGFLSLSGGRLGGGAPRAADAGRPRQASEPLPEAAPAGAAPAASPDEPTCDFSHIFAIGEHEISTLPTTSTMAAKHRCEARVRRDPIVDTEPGYVHDGGRQDPATKAWGRLPRPGTAEVYVYPDCAEGRVIADVVRVDKGHTEGLEPAVTEQLVRLMVSDRGGKIQRGS